jgi:hypothetical protein
MSISIDVRGLIARYIDRRTAIIAGIAAFVGLLIGLML